MPSAVDRLTPGPAALLLFYGKEVLPQTFTATLNGVNVTPWFRPAPRTHELFKLPLNTGTNVLVLSIDGIVRNQTLKDTDRLVFLVP